MSSIPTEVEKPPVGIQDRALVVQCRAGSQRAFQTLVERHHAAAYRLALRIVRSARDAEEVAQDAFVAAWSNLGDFRGDAAFSTWLYRIVVRRALDRAASLKTRRTREAPLEDAAPGGPAGADSSAPPSPANARRMQLLLSALTEAQHAVITLYYYEDLPVAEIGRILSLPEGTVKTHLARARAALREGWLRASRSEAAR